MATPTIEPGPVDPSFWEDCEELLPHDGSVWSLPEPMDDSQERQLAAIIEEYWHNTVRAAQKARRREEELN